MRSSIFLLLTLLAATAFGQQNKTDIGVEGSPDVIMLRGNHFATNNNYPALGFSGGFFFQYHFSKILSLRTNISFERKGAYVDKILTDNDGFPIAQAAWPSRFDYLTLPVLLRVTVGKKIKYFVNAGAFSGYLTKQTVVYNNSGVITPIPSEDNTHLYKRVDAGITAGFGIVIPVREKLAIAMEMRDNLGLLNINKTQANSNAVKTNSTNLLLGLTYKIGTSQEAKN